MFEVILPVIAALFISPSFPISPTIGFEHALFVRKIEHRKEETFPKRNSAPTLFPSIWPTIIPTSTQPTIPPQYTPEPTPIKSEPTPTQVVPTFYPTGMPEPEPSMPYPIDPPPCPWKYDPATMKRPIIDGEEELIMPCVHL